ncbi:amino acid transporter [Ramicandelaber brevisporus]|nr:amino acid transporter [Ramicandelaber brevisporus]
MGVLSGVAQVAGVMLGAGIFSTGSLVVNLVGGPVQAIIMWVFGAVLTLAAAVSFIEFGAMLPQSGGAQRYLDYVFKRPRSLLPFMFCFCTIMCTEPSNVAAVSVVFGKYILYATLGRSAANAETGNSGGDSVAVPSPWVERGIGIGCLLFITVLNCVSVRWSVRVNNFLTMFKILVLLLISFSGIIVLTGATSIPRQLDNWHSTIPDFAFSPRNYASALFKIMFAFDGWNNLNYSLGELKNPKRNLPIAVGSGVATVSVLYVLANVAYFSVVPMSLIETSKEILAGDYCRIVFGETFGRVVLPLFVAVSCLGSVSAMIFGMSRVIVVAAQENYIPYGKSLGRINARFGTPFNALVFNALVILMYIVLPPPGDVFDLLVDLQGYPMWVFYGITGTGLLVLRFREPDTHRPFKALWVAPVLFVGSSLFLSVVPFIPPNYTAAALNEVKGFPYWLAPTAGALIILLSIPIYLYQRRFF